MSEETLKLDDATMEEISQIINEVNAIIHELGRLSLSMEKLQSKKVELINIYDGNKNKLEEKAKDSIIEAGIPEEESEKYTIDISKGEIVSRESIQKM